MCTLAGSTCDCFSAFPQHGPRSEKARECHNHNPAKRPSKQSLALKPLANKGGRRCCRSHSQYMHTLSQKTMDTISCKLQCSTLFKCVHYDSCVACPHVGHGRIPCTAFVQQAFLSRAISRLPLSSSTPSPSHLLLHGCSLLHRPTSEFMFSNSPNKSPAESLHRPGTAMPPSR